MIGSRSRRGCLRAEGAKDFRFWGSGRRADADGPGFASYGA